MKASQSLPRPENWQDFETLCKKLWGEIWDCPEIMKNGRSGQSQSGIDIYGIPKNEEGYYGIQCKGICEYNNKQLTEDEIIIEIEKAKLFEPQLQKMYFATTALKDSKVETIIRKKNIEHRNNDLFEIHIYCWEDIVDLIFENKATYDYYLNSQTFKKRHSVQVTFGNGRSELKAKSKFVQKKHIAKSEYEKMERTAEKFISPIIKNQLKWQEKMWKNHGILDVGGFSSSSYTEINRSFIESKILVENNGSEPLEHWKLTIYYPKEIVELSDDNKEKKGSFIVSVHRAINYDTCIDIENHRVELEPRKKILVGDDSFLSKPIFLKPKAESRTIEIPWKLVSKNFKEEGSLKIIVEIEFDYKWVKVPNDSPLLLEEQTRVTIEDFIERVDDDSG
jgi:hypothetical protein